MPTAPSPAGDPAVRVRVPAKVNLHLGVGPIRPDGYHELLTVFHAVDLVDEIIARPGAGVALTLEGEGAGELPVDDTNLAWRAATLLADTAGVAPDVHLELRKAIPVAGGMAGGSADGAATLLACSRLWGLELARDELMQLAARLGSDATFPLVGGTAVGGGRGELITATPTAGELHWVFALAGFGISSGECYRVLDEMRAAGETPPPIPAPDKLLAAVEIGDVDAVGANLANDMQPAALRLVPALDRTLDAGRRHGAIAGIVSGSGPTCAFLCRDASAAVTLAAALEADGVCRTARVARGPAPGAAVV